MRKIEPEKSPRRSKTQLLLSDKDWRAILDGGTSELADGDDFEGSAGAAKAQLVQILTERLGTWTVTADQKNRTVTINVTRPIS